MRGHERCQGRRRDPRGRTAMALYQLDCITDAPLVASTEHAGRAARCTARRRDENPHRPSAQHAVPMQMDERLRCKLEAAWFLGWDQEEAAMSLVSSP